MLTIIYLLGIVSISLLFIGIYNASKASERKIRLPEALNKAPKVKLHSFIGVILPSRRLLERLNLHEKLKHKLDAARVKLAAEEFFNLKLFSAIAFGASTFFVASRFQALPFTVGALLGFFIPDIWINRQIAKRKYVIARLLPETVDLLALCVEAGLDFTTAVRWIIEKTSMNPMVEELAFVLEEIKWGKPRTQALKDMSRRLNIPEVSTFVQTLVQAERMGTPVAEAFTILSEDTRLQRFRAGERFAMQAPIKILIPLIFCILPVIAIIVGGPIFLQFSSGGLLTGIGVGK